MANHVDKNLVIEALIKHNLKAPATIFDPITEDTNIIIYDSNNDTQLVSVGNLISPDYEWVWDFSEYNVNLSLTIHTRLALIKCGKHSGQPLRVYDKYRCRTKKMFYNDIIKY